MKKITEQLLNEVSNKAAAADRRRTNHNFHKDYGERVQRLLNAAEPGTYIRPHKHEDPDKVEVFIVLRGSVVVVEFDDEGAIIDHALLSRDKGTFAVELPPRVWHTFICLEPRTVLYEAKEGPYDETADKHFAPWAPAEGSPAAEGFTEGVLAKLKLTAGT
jgi:cupin fold WbuC family metalloprotein